MNKKEIISMVLAGGQGSRLGVLTKRLAKPAVPFGGKYRIIDFTLSNCSNSGIDTVGVLTQYKPLELNSHIGIGSSWDLDRRDGGVYILSPYQEENGGNWYKGTADAIYQNMSFIDSYNPEYVLVLSGDHIYKMNYLRMLDFHKEKGADATIAVIDVPMSEASRFGIMNTKEDMRIYGFEEKPQNPTSTNASMGIYIFNWKILKKFLIADQKDNNSSNDFGKNIIPNMLDSGLNLYAYPFKGYWKDVGTVKSLWEANMDLLRDDNELDLRDPKWRIYSADHVEPAQYIGPNAEIKTSIAVDGCEIYGRVYNSIIFSGSIIGENSTVINSVVMPNTKIENNVLVNKAIIGSNAVIKSNSSIGNDKEITVIGSNTTLESGSILSSCN
ncbi:glucose-1-phosphate adenylyltransferase [Clostridium sp. cel8]|jgi:glucose-1-phosphate adenylyltransferase|uniref:glucose-1-phosphate adenylyltransferase n=1 Tax=unclassified Clostridium TaxID=2614128 RepID=UPI0015F3867D|nr:glucose-1-phosphate adenylyltransferase [Clostridium sp. cel8]MBA5851710.1 glucose-1-phosphate adenylyltransferase [Clostridium sp. cel8]